MIRRALLVAALGLAFAGPVGAEDGPASAGTRKVRELVDRYLVAFRAGDEAGMAFVRDRPMSQARDPFWLANDLFRRHIDGALRDPPAPGDFLPAARAMARCVRDIKEDEGLADLVERWDGWGAEELRRGAGLQNQAYLVTEAASRGEVEGALALASRARAEAVAAEGSISAVGILGSLADGLGRMGRTPEAIEAFKEASRAAARVRWSVVETGNLWQAGYLCYRRGDLPAARTLWREQLAAIDARVGAWARPEPLRWIAAAEAGLGEYGEALDLVRRSIEEARAVGDGYQEAISTESLGRMHAALGHYAEALDALERARGMYLAGQKSVLGAANALDAMGSIYTELGRPARAIAALRESLSELESIGYRGEAARARADLGAACEAQGLGAEALDAMERALAEWESMHDRLGGAKTLGLLGDLHRREGRLDRALDCQRKALEQMESMGNRPGAARAKAALAEIREARGEHSLALDLGREALVAMEEVGDRRGAARALRGMAGAQRSLSRPAEALALSGRAIDLQVALGSGLGEEDAAGIRREARAAADIGILAAWELAAAEPGEASRAVAEAFHLAESSRGLHLGGGMVYRAALFAAFVPAGLREAEAAARSSVAARRRELAEQAAREGPDREGLAAARAGLEASYRALEDAVARVQREALRAAEVVIPRPVPLDEFRASLPATDALLLYHLAPGRAFALVATRDGAQLVDLGGADALAVSAEAYLDLVSVDGSEEGPRAAALYDALLRPLEGALAGRTRLLVCPDGVLAFLPFEALLRMEGDRRERAVERWEMAYVPSATIASLGAGRGEAPGEGILAVGDPSYPGESPAAAPAGSRDAELRGMGLLRRLPGTAAEARAVAALVPAEKRVLLLRERASVAALRDALAATKGRLASLHLACHGHLDAERPWLTGLVLAGGEVLGLDDIYRMKVPADLVVLSACESGRGRILQGEGVMGLARGFLHAGASRVVVSDWAVSDEAARALMESFYRRMLREGRSPGEALRAAKIEALRSGGPLAHPAHWAAFVLWGD